MTHKHTPDHSYRFLMHLLEDEQRESERALQQGSEFESEHRKNKEIRMKNHDKRTKGNSFERGEEQIKWNNHT